MRQFAQNGSRALLLQAIAKVEQLEVEHEGAGDILKQLRQVTGDYAVPPDGCGTFERAYTLLQALEGDLFRHIHLENNILHTRLRELSRKLGD